MPIDASIPLQAKPIQLDNPLASYANVMAIQGAMNQNKLHDLQYRKMETDLADERAVKEAFQGAGGDLTGARNALMGRGLYKPALALDEAERKRRLETANITEKDIKAAKDRMEAFSGLIAPLATRESVTHDDVLNMGKQAQAMGLLPPGWEAGVPVNAMELPKFVKGLAMATEQGRKAIDMLLPKAHFADTGGSIQAVNQNPMAGQIGAPMGVATPKTATPGEAMRAPLIQAQTNQALAQTGEIGNQNWQVDAQRGVRTNRATGETQPLTVNGAPLGPNPKDAREDADSLRKEFESKPAVKEYRATIPVVESARKAPDTRAGDIQLAYSVGKILDPDSVVREGELKLVGNAATIMERIQGELRTLALGKGRLTPETRKELLTMLDTAVGERERAYRTERQTYEGIASRRNHKLEDVIVDIAPTSANTDAIKNALRATGKPYEPNKYEYRIIDGKVQRKAKP